jgi:hypothetical protein
MQRMILAALFVSFSATLVWGEDAPAVKKPEGEAARGKGPGRPDFAEIIKKFDKDGDGKLNDEEKAAAREAMAGKGRPGAGGPGRPDFAEIIKKFDKDGDGKLNDEEKAAAREAMAGKGRPGGAGAPSREELMKKFDKDGDGKLSEEERAAAKAAFQARGKKPE